MNNKRTYLFLFICFFISVLWADKIVLNEGKVLHGKITNETDTVVTINLGQNMMLRVNRDKIKSIHKTKREKKHKGPVVTMDSLQKAEEKKLKEENAEIEKAAENPAAGVPVQSSVVDNVGTGDPVVKKEDKADGKAQMEIVLTQETYPVSEKTFARVLEKISDPDKGLGFVLQRERVPSETALKLEWDGKSGNEDGRVMWTEIKLNAHIVVKMPFWKHPDDPDPKDIDDWNKFLKNVLEHDQKHVEIYKSNISSLARALSQLRAPDEKTLRQKSDQTLNKFLERIENQQKGHDRRNPVSPQ